MDGSIRTNVRVIMMGRGVKRDEGVEREKGGWPRSPSDMFSVQAGCFSTDEGFERPLQHRGPIEVPLVVRQFVCPSAIFVYGTRGGTRDALAVDEPRPEVLPVPNGVEGLPPESRRQPPEAERMEGSSPKVVEVVRERTLEEAIESQSLWCRAVLGRSVGEVTKPKVTHI